MQKARQDVKSPSGFDHSITYLFIFDIQFF